MTLTRHQRELLEFERRFPRHTNEKEVAVSEFFDTTIKDYEAQLASVIDLPAAREYDQTLVDKVLKQRKALRWFNERNHLDWR